MLRLRLQMDFAAVAYNEAAGALRSLVGPVRAEPGCSATQLLTNTEGSSELTWVEEWRSVEDFERHLRAPIFRNILAVIELAAGPPRVEIDDVNSRRGFELIEEILAATPTQSAGHEAG